MQGAELIQCGSLYSVEHGGIVVLTKSELEVVDRICSILKPFYDATLEISRDDACISVVIPIVRLLLGKLQASAEDVGLLQMKAAVRDAIHRRFAYIKTAQFSCSDLAGSALQGYVFYLSGEGRCESRRSHIPSSACSGSSRQARR